MCTWGFLFKRACLFQTRCLLLKVLVSLVIGHVDGQVLPTISQALVHDTSKTLVFLHIIGTRHLENCMHLYTCLDNTPTHLHAFLLLAHYIAIYCTCITQVPFLLHHKRVATKHRHMVLDKNTLKHHAQDKTTKRRTQ